MKPILVVFFSFFLTFLLASDPYPRNEALDILQYTFRLEFNDTTDRLAGEATVTLLFRKTIGDFELDLVGKGAGSYGMTVSEIQSENSILKFVHEKNRLRIFLPAASGPGETKTFIIRYAGIPEEGMVISKNKFGDRTFFGDNWPDRGHHWLPCIDHPSDKAKVEFIIVAPEKYQVVASGRKTEETNLPHHQKRTHWEESVEIPVKVMTVGVARFAVEQKAEVDHIPQSTWVYPQNRDEGFYDFAVGTKIFEFFHRNIGPYSYEKLAHVQSKTRWGGLENASNIFYTENSVTGKNDHEGLIAHETAHQWFGNSVTENDWYHVWLSEGFATYFASLYTEHAHGREAFVEEMKSHRQDVIDYFKKNQNPVIDTTIVDISKVLNTNTYPKAGWVLHMLRRDIGDDTFWKGIQNYYAAYRNKNAMTNDFVKVMEKVSGKDLSTFFDQWLYRGGHPQLMVTWAYDKKTRKVNLTVRQKQTRPLTFPLDILIRFPNGKFEQRTIQVKAGSAQVSVESKASPSEVTLDPSCWLLFEAELKGR